MKTNAKVKLWVQVECEVEAVWREADDGDYFEGCWEDHDITICDGEVPLDFLCDHMVGPEPSQASEWERMSEALNAAKANWEEANDPTIQ